MLHQRALEQGDFPREFKDLVAQPHPHVQRHLVIARTGSVELGAGGHAPCQLGLDIHVDVLQLRLPLKAAGGNLLADVIQRFQEGTMFVRPEHTDFLQHRGVRDGTEDVLAPEAPIERNGLAEPRDVRAGTAGKPPAA